jgi:hypothetical protein
MDRRRVLRVSCNPCLHSSAIVVDFCLHLSLPVLFRSGTSLLQHPPSFNSSRPPSPVFPLPRSQSVSTPPSKSSPSGQPPRPRPGTKTTPKATSWSSGASSIKLSRESRSLGGGWMRRFRRGRSTSCSCFPSSVRISRPLTRQRWPHPLPRHLAPDPLLQMPTRPTHPIPNPSFSSPHSSPLIPSPPSRPAHKPPSLSLKDSTLTRPSMPSPLRR